jgi:SP family general alpha glucoside:H+ symporter-like MFS transporter
MVMNLVLITAFVFITFFAPNVQKVLVGAIFCRIPWEVFATMGPAYATKVCPLVLRGLLTAFVNLCWTIEQLFSIAALKGFVNNTTRWSCRKFDFICINLDISREATFFFAGIPFTKH